MVSCGIAWRAALALIEAACSARDCSSASASRWTRGETCPSIRQTCLSGPKCYKAIGCPSHRGLIDGEERTTLSGDTEPRVSSFGAESRIFRQTHLEHTGKAETHLVSSVLV
ncbi:hypothetical protein ROHU_015308 [Labeo rohita]|uniref:Secreted protein n=1 Tax=Labeo rohita TaxID=84645 RepID=A0A498NQ94_LABRO|nr:hypothetical protein ROHU_035080 [Labeo rohita]RXN33869.1 hypothetical protein ROHU_015308 [Labeo rohita]